MGYWGRTRREGVDEEEEDEDEEGVNKEDEEGGSQRGGSREINCEQQPGVSLSADAQPAAASFC